MGLEELGRRTLVGVFFEVIEKLEGRSGIGVRDRILVQVRLRKVRGLAVAKEIQISLDGVLGFLFL